VIQCCRWTDSWAGPRRWLVHAALLALATEVAATVLVMVAEVNHVLSGLGRSAFAVSIHASLHHEAWIDFWVAAERHTQDRAGFSEVFSRVSLDAAYALTAADGTTVGGGRAVVEVTSWIGEWA
jgi:hypothetical protein